MIDLLIINGSSDKKFLMNNMEAGREARIC